MSRARRNIMWPLVIIAVGSVWLLHVAGAFPDVVGDILTRAWPALLVLFGFDVLAAQRQLRIAGRGINLSLLGMVLLAVFLAGVIWFGYQAQADVLRDDNQVDFAETLSDDVTRVQLDFVLERTTVTISPAAGDARALQAAFKGSRESDVEMVWAVQGDTGTLTISETYRSSIPRLEDLGRGTLDVTLPAGVVIEAFSLSAAEGTMVADLRPLRVEQLDLALDDGDLTLSLPGQDTLVGNVRLGSGDLLLNVPREMALTLKANGNPNYDFDRDRYDLLVDGPLKLRNVASFQISLDVWIKNGALLKIVDVE